MNEQPVTTKCQIQLEIHICPLAAPHATVSKMAEAYTHLSKYI